ncbi:hypothetical protein PT279_02730, partial [Bifidobacterium sp. ESL0784]|uniref:hypothetical protein n=1 Tax=Bifidobacterium sp. ESL0784 TaxID=2983231 RepID=UPI0023FA1CE4
RQQGEQQAARLEDKIRRLHTLDQTTRNLYQNATPQSGNGMGLGDLAAGGMSKTDMAEMFENEYGMSKEQAEQLAEFTIRFHAYAKEQGWNSQQEAYEYACIIGSIGYGPDSGGDGGKLWGIAANTMSHDQLISMLAAIGYPKGKKDNPKIGTAEYFINDMLLFHQGKDEHEKILKHPAKVDFVHEMASLAAMLNTDPKSALYHEGTSIFIPNPLNPKMPVKLPSNYREAATWGGDIASGSMDADDLHADMDAINLQQRLTEHPSQDPMKILNDYNRRVEHDPRRRADEFLGNYDPTGGHDPDKGMAWLKGTAGAQSFLPPGDVALGLDALRKGLDPAKTYRFFFQTLDRERGR